MLNQSFLFRDKGAITFFLINILLINIIGYSIGFRMFLIYYSLLVIIFCIARDIILVQKNSLFDIRIFLLSGTVVWYYIPLLFGKISNIELVNSVIVNYSLSLIFVSKKFKIIIKEEFLSNKNNSIIILIIIYSIYKIYSINGNVFAHILLSRESEEFSKLVNTNSTVLQSLLNALDIIFQMAISYGLYINFIKKKWFLTIFYTFLIIVVSIESGFRTLMIFLLFPIIVVFMSQGKFIKIGIASIILLLFAKFMLTNRNEINVYYTDLNPLDAAVQTTDLYSETEYVFNNIDRFKSSEQNDFLIYATFLIPRSIFKSKPVPGVVRDYTLMKWGKDILREDGNVFPGIYLNFYLTYGFIGGIIMFISFQYFILYFFVLLYRKYNSVFFLSLYFANLFLNFRSNSPMFYFYIMAPLIILTLTKRNSFKYEIH